jgi:DhnA family fructose-bisphosphate aldolase class Ia
VNSLRLNRLFGAIGRAVVVACDHGEFFRSPGRLRDPLDLLAALGDIPDGVLMSPGTLRRSASVLGRRSAPVPIVRLNWNSIYDSHEDPPRAAGAIVIDAEEAVRLGADVALIGLTLNTGSETDDATNVEQFCEGLLGCRRVGLPVIGEYYPAGSRDGDPALLHDDVIKGVRIIAELGADVVKSFLEPTWNDVIAACPVPLLGLGAERRGSDLEALQFAQRQMQAGAQGVVYGRNVFQSDDPLRMTIALGMVVRENVDPAEALRRAAEPAPGAPAN